MGGQSFKCPYCEKWWTLQLGSLKDHLKDKHGMPGAVLKMEGPFVKAIEFTYKGVCCTDIPS